MSNSHGQLGAGSKDNMISNKNLNFRKNPKGSPKAHIRGKLYTLQCGPKADWVGYLKIKKN